MRLPLSGSMTIADLNLSMLPGEREIAASVESQTPAPRFVGGGLAAYSLCSQLIKDLPWVNENATGRCRTSQSWPCS
ncbi:hypothetical protein FQZ97_529440 [compost metagenome]